MFAYQRIGIARDHASPENPGALDRRVVMAPTEVKQLCERGLKVSVETGAGLGVDHSDDDYRAAGADIVSRAEVYGGKDLVLKLKGVALEDIDAMDRGTVLFCMAHFHSFPDRAQRLEEAGIQVVAMEEILHSPNKLPDDIVIGKGAMRQWLKEHPAATTELDVVFVGYSELLVGAFRRAGNRNPARLTLLRPDVPVDRRPRFHERTLVAFDSASDVELDDARSELLDAARAAGARVLDVQSFKADNPGEVGRYWTSHPPYPLGGRRIQCLHETGMAGAGYGLKLLADDSALKRRPTDVTAVVLGYGNVGMGAIHRCYDKGVPVIEALTRATTVPDRIEPFLEGAHLVVNGAEQPRELRGKRYLLTRRHAAEVLPRGAVVIDLVGGSAVNRSAVEGVVACTFLNEPHFEQDGVFYSSLWGWPMMGMMAESAQRYSGQVMQVLVEDRGLLFGLEGADPGTRRAVLSGPFAAGSS